MKRLSHCVWIGTFICLLGTACPIYAEGSLNLIWSDPYQMLPWARETTKRRVKEMFRELLVELHWSEVEQGGDSVRIILTPNPPTQWGLPENTMGVVLGCAVPRRAVFIFPRNVLRTLGYEIGTEWPGPRIRVHTTRGLSRVIAHELVHALRPDLTHSSHGLMKTHLMRADLIQPRTEWATSIATELASLSGGTSR
jgi:hypothetical protein